MPGTPSRPASPFLPWIPSGPVGPGSPRSPRSPFGPEEPRSPATPVAPWKVQKEILFFIYLINVFGDIYRQTRGSRLSLLSMLPRWTTQLFACRFVELKIVE